MNPTFFATPADFRAWFDAHHATAGELWVGFYKKCSSSRPSITWPESVDQALCYGWIDGLRRANRTATATPSASRRAGPIATGAPST